MELRKHPAKFSQSILELLDEILPNEGLFLDPFGGTGKIHRLGRNSVSLEIEPEWAQSSDLRTIIGNALCLPFAVKTFDCVCTSPTYGNRLADHHEAKDNSWRASYKHMLGRMPNNASSATLQWGETYRDFHKVAWREVKRVLKPDGLFALNISNHIRNKKEMLVTEWHVECCEDLGFKVERWEKVDTPRMRMGANANVRVEYESVICFKQTPM